MRLERLKLVWDELILLHDAYKDLTNLLATRHIAEKIVRSTRKAPHASARYSFPGQSFLPMDDPI
jgi:hypothetical protein